MSALKRLIRLVVATPGVVPKFLRKSDTGVIFMLHRFPDPAMGNVAEHELGAIREMLGYLRRHNFDLVPLMTLFERADAGQPLRGAVAFTIDDGYLDHARIGARVFAEFDCPSTTFLTSGFLDGKIWFWWDKIDYIFDITARRELTIVFDESAPARRYAWSSPDERAHAQYEVTEECKRVPDAAKHAAIERLAATAEVTLPESCPAKYAPMTWADARESEKLGMTFGPHSVNHPILARTSDAQSKFEIEESWRRVSAEVARPVPIFCYPNGQVGDFGDREVNTIGKLGLRGAVVGSAGYATGEAIRGERSRFVVQRFGMPGSMAGFADLIQAVTGIERLKDRVRGRRG